MYYKLIGLTEEEYKEYNKQLIEKYPWLLPHNRWTDEVSEDYDYSYTELDDMPVGWRFVFGEQMCAEIQELLVKVDYVDKYRIMQIKEKYGSLRWYEGGIPTIIADKYYALIAKYENLSLHTCIHCGKPARYISRGWISPFCKTCNKWEDSYTIEEYFEDEEEEE